MREILSPNALDAKDDHALWRLNSIQRENILSEGFWQYSRLLIEVTIASNTKPSGCGRLLEKYSLQDSRIFLVTRPDCFCKTDRTRAMRNDRTRSALREEQTQLSEHFYHYGQKSGLYQVSFYKWYEEEPKRRVEQAKEKWKACRKEWEGWQVWCRSHVWAPSIFFHRSFKVETSGHFRILLKSPIDF